MNDATLQNLKMKNYFRHIITLNICREHVFMTKKKLFSWFGRSKQRQETTQESVATAQIEKTQPSTFTDHLKPQQIKLAEQVATTNHLPSSPHQTGLFASLAQRLSKTKERIGSGLADLLLGRKIDDALFEELETQLLVADVGVQTTQSFIEELTEKVQRKELNDGQALYQHLKLLMQHRLEQVQAPLTFSQPTDGPYVVLMLGVNGVGKTTSIGKIAHQLCAQGKSVMLAAGDTFRAAAVEQLQVWGQRNQVPVIAQAAGADSASVIYDAYHAAKTRGIDVLIADTAGRLQNKTQLMEELKKIVRVLKKCALDTPHEVMLTLDAGIGQNAINQMKLFHETVPITGICLTKLDGTAKGGIIFAITDQFKVPIRYIGVGEQVDDLQPFIAKDFISALFKDTSANNNLS